MTVERNKVNGSIVIIDVVKGYALVRVYYGYPKREAIRAFKREAKAIK
jgi:hypothetical protein